VHVQYRGETVEILLEAWRKHLTEDLDSEGAWGMKNLGDENLKVK
jgi:hypothetical protein